MGGTDCALPMIYAKQKKLKIDVFIVYTDSETWFGKIHPTEALKQYRRVCVCVCLILLYTFIYCTIVNGLFFGSIKFMLLSFSTYFTINII